MARCDVVESHPKDLFLIFTMGSNCNLKFKSIQIEMGGFSFLILAITNYDYGIGCNLILSVNTVPQASFQVQSA